METYFKAWDRTWYDTKLIGTKASLFPIKRRMHDWGRFGCRGGNEERERERERVFAECFIKLLLPRHLVTIRSTISESKECNSYIHNTRLLNVITKLNQIESTIKLHLKMKRRLPSLDLLEIQNNFSV